MKTRGLILFAVLGFGGSLQGQDLFLTFSGSGASTSVDSVRVENLTRGEKLIVGGSQVLHLEQVVTETGKLTAGAKSGITFSPNPMIEYSVMEFSVPGTGRTVISIIDLGGKEILKINDDLSRGHHSYRLSGLQSGLHFVRVSSGQYSSTGTLVSISSGENARAEYIGTASAREPDKEAEAFEQQEPVKRSGLAEVTMRFREGDSLKFTAASGNYRTIVIDAPDTSKTMTFDFYECIDGDGNNYPVIEIGGEIWMAENLKTTRFNDGTAIRNEKDDSTWATLDNKGINSIPAYCWYNNDENYKDVYGGLYNNPAVSGAGGKNVCPAGWHVAAGEWNELFSYLDNAAAPDGEVSKFAGNLVKEEGNLHWRCPDNRATNETGFTALPGGLRKPYFAHLGERAYFWDGSNGKFILYCTSGVVGHIYSKYDYGLSVRCVKDQPVVKDIEGNAYEIVEIGSQVWMKENLRTTKFSDGTAIGLITDNTAWWNSVSPAYCFYPGMDQKVYGALYNWESVSTGKLCPSGWRVPLETDWSELTDYLIANGYNYDGTYSGNKIAKAMAEYGLWHSSAPLQGTPGNYDYPEKMNASGFSARPAGTRTDVFYWATHAANFWSSTADNSTGFSFGITYMSESFNKYNGNMDGKQPGFSVRCIFGEHMIPGVESSLMSGITATKASSGGSILTDHGLPVIQKGVCWSKSPLPTINDPHTTEGPGPDSFTSAITGLTPATNYYVRAYATSSAGTGYGMSIPFMTKITDTIKVITDIEGNSYEITQIGTQVWMKENLGTTKLNDGTPIRLITDDDTAWWNSVTPAYCFYPGIDKKIYGAIYNWQSVNSGRLCPSGWHVPSDKNWTELIDYLIANGYNYDGTYSGNKIAKAMAQYGLWKSSDNSGTPGKDDYPGKTNATLFSARPGGQRNLAFSKSFNEFSAFWSSTPFPYNLIGDHFTIWYDQVTVAADYPDPGDKQGGFAVRCIYGEEIPVVETLPLMSDITATKASSGGSILADHGLLTQKGVCWSTSALPTLNDPHTSEGPGTGSFISFLTGLTPATRYNARAYATNSAGTGYGMSIPFITKKTDVIDSITDIEGNFYGIIQIGAQVWMKENLRTTKLNDGTLIGVITGDDLAWWNSVTPAYCFYPGIDPKVYGAIYNWQSVNTGKLCPAGWHVPSNGDWALLTDYLITNGYNYDGSYSENKIAKSMSEYGLWKNSNRTGSVGNIDFSGIINASGFSARPGGSRGLYFSYNYNDHEIFWSSTPRHFTGDYLVLSNSTTHFFQTGPDSGDKQSGWAVRCLKDK